MLIWVKTPRSTTSWHHQGFSNAEKGIQTGLYNIRKEKKVSSAEDISSYFRNKKIQRSSALVIYTFSLHVCVLEPCFCPSVLEGNTEARSPEKQLNLLQCGFTKRGRSPPPPVTPLSSRSMFAVYLFTRRREKAPAAFLFVLFCISFLRRVGSFKVASDRPRFRQSREKNLMSKEFVWSVFCLVEGRLNVRGAEEARPL